MTPGNDVRATGSDNGSENRREAHPIQIEPRVSSAGLLSMRMCRTGAGAAPGVTTEYSGATTDSKAVSWLVYGAVDMGDEGMERQAGESLILMPNAVGHLAGDHRDRRDRYEQMLRNPALLAFIEEQGLPTSVD